MNLFRSFYFSIRISKRKLQPKLQKSFIIMVMSKLNRISLLTLGLNTILFAQTYTIQQHDTLSDIAFSVCRKIYGPRGFIKKIINENSSLQPFDEKKLPIGLSLKIPLEKCSSPQREISQNHPPAENPDIAKNETPPVTEPNSTSVTQAIVTSQNTSRLFLSPYLMFKTIKATEKADGAHATLTTTLLPGFKLGFLTPWTETFSSNLWLGYHQEKFRKISGRDIDNATVSRWHFAVATNYIFKLGWIWGNDFKVEEKSFVGDSTTTQINIKTGTTKSLQTRLAKTLFDRDQRKFQWELKARYFFPVADRDIKATSGSGYGIAFVMTDSHIKSGFQASLFFDKNQQNSNLFKQAEELVGLQLDFLIK
jgi:hypothetical protein